jgi:hypothetical protein
MLKRSTRACGVAVGALLAIVMTGAATSAPPARPPVVCHSIKPTKLAPLALSTTREEARAICQSSITLSFTMGTDGIPQDVQVLKSDPPETFDKPWRISLKNSKFELLPGCTPCPGRYESEFLTKCGEGNKLSVTLRQLVCKPAEAPNAQ